MTACANRAPLVLFRRFCFVAAAFVLLLTAQLPTAARASVTWTDLAQGGYVILLRHTTTVPGVGDPPGFRLDDCATQRNLSEQGREEARRWGEMMVKNRVPVSKVFTSQWCRCVDTARLAFGALQPAAAIEAWPALNSFFETRTNEPAQTAAVKSRLAKLNTRGQNIVLVTHQVNISALSGETPAMGEAIVVRVNQRGVMTVEGRLRVP
jgi:broad specificity phosphatase PhoE